MDFSVLLDAPDTSARRIQIARLGDFKDKRYGDFSITPADAESWAKNLNVLPGGKALIDLEHRSERSPRDSRAAGWLSDIQVDGNVVTAEVDWTPLGRQKVADGEYRFFSPTFGTYKDEHGTAYENTLVSGALTNKPFLTRMAGVSLASADTVRDALADEIARLTELSSDFAPHPAADSRRPMNPDALKLLGLDENADDAKILDALTELKGKADTAAPAAAAPEPTKTLEQQAADSGMRLLEDATVRQLVADAAAGRQAADELKAAKFDRAFTAALDDGKAIPAQREQFEKVYALDADTALAMLDSAPPIVNVKPAAAARELTADTLTELPADKQFAARIELEQKTGVSYEQAYLKVLDQMEAGR